MYGSGLLASHDKHACTPSPSQVKHDASQGRHVFAVVTKEVLGQFSVQLSPDGSVTDFR